ncbi:TraR/DksA C4-type zinc finger protein [Candidatus Collierbacteria bacterium]|nr:TraR/DksA C4-type zinc finger protein [Candidatus Collierbacteria bacterium]
MKKDEATSLVRFPGNLLRPLVSYLKNEERRLIKTKKSLKKEDPYATMSREEDNSVDADVAEQVDHERVSAVRTELAKSLINIRKTLTRIKIGRYGICERCHKMIDTDRLAIEPTAEYCVNCRKEIEAESAGKRKK